MQTVIAFALRVVLGGLMVLAGALKLPDPTAFATEITNYRFLPGLAPWMAATMPSIEIALGLALVAAPIAWRRSAALATLGVMLLFTIALTQVVVRGINVDCGCFGGGSGPVTWLTVGRDLVLMAMAAGILWLERPRTSAA